MFNAREKTSFNLVLSINTSGLCSLHPVSLNDRKTLPVNFGTNLMWIIQQCSSEHPFEPHTLWWLDIALKFIFSYILKLHVWLYNKNVNNKKITFNGRFPKSISLSSQKLYNSFTICLCTATEIDYDNFFFFMIILPELC